MTAEEFVRDYENDPYIELDSDWRKLMIEFAKYHVEKALKAASENVSLYDCGTDEYIGNEIDSLVGDRIEISKETILEAYPLDNIK